VIVLPYPVSVNRYWKNFRGRTVRSKEAIEYKEAVASIANEFIDAPLVGCVSVSMTLHPERPKDWEKRQRKDARWGLGVRRIDLDNAMKVAIDALQDIAFENDRQITKLTIKLGQPIEGGGLSVSICADEFWESPQ